MGVGSFGGNFMPMGAGLQITSKVQSSKGGYYINERFSIPENYESYYEYQKKYSPEINNSIMNHENELQMSEYITNIEVVEEEIVHGSPAGGIGV